MKRSKRTKIKGRQRNKEKIEKDGDNGKTKKIKKRSKRSKRREIIGKIIENDFRVISFSKKAA